MNLLSPVSEIMSKDLVTIGPQDKLTAIKELFAKHKIHHIPVVRYKSIVGLISKTDLFLFERGFSKDGYSALVEKSRMESYCAEDIMTKGLAKLDPSDRIDVALEIFKENLFHAIPVVSGTELVGIVTTYDIIKALSEGRLEPTRTYQK